MDLDGDGHPDLISGSWPDEIFFFKGGPNRTFAPPVKLRHKDGKAINVGGGKRDSGDMLLIAGDATFEKDAKGKSVIRYEGEVIEVPEGKQAGITGTASAVHAVDWDGDGKIDLLIGSIGGQVHLVPNEGTAKAPVFGKPRALRAGGKPLVVPGDAGPFAADWDGDGKIDLLVGAGDGSVWFYRNVGTAKEPALAAGVRLVAPGTVVYGPDAPKEAKRGVRAKICVVDYNGDGRPDLLVGDFATQRPDRPKPSAEEQARIDKAKKEWEEAVAQYTKAVAKISAAKPVEDKAEREKAEKEIQTLMKRREELWKALPREYERHGWVWFFERKPLDKTASK